MGSSCSLLEGGKIHKAGGISSGDKSNVRSFVQNDQWSLVAILASKVFQFLFYLRWFLERIRLYLEIYFLDDWKFRTRQVIVERACKIRCRDTWLNCVTEHSTNFTFISIFFFNLMFFNFFLLLYVRYVCVPDRGWSITHVHQTKYWMGPYRVDPSWWTSYDLSSSLEAINLFFSIMKKKAGSVSEEWEIDDNGKP